MARQRKPLCKLCRREGSKLFLKGSRCTTDKCSITRRSYAPGQHGQKRVKLSDYGMQMREKQKAKKIYGLLERQFRHYFSIAENSKGVTGEVLLQLLERRLDNVVYRLLFAASRQGARQIIGHGRLYVNKKKVNVPSYLVTVGDIIEVKADEKLKKKIQDLAEIAKDTRAVPAWLAPDYTNVKGEIKRLPIKDDIGYAIQEQLIVELYSK